MLLDYLQYRPSIAASPDIASTACAIGRTRGGAGLVLRDYATLRADGESISVGERCHFGERATVHIADGKIPTVVGDDVTVARYALVHACTLGRGVVVGEAATVMDGATVGDHALIAAGALVPPRKALAGGFVYAGNPASPLREIARDELEAIAAALRAGAHATLATAEALPPLDMSPFVADGAVRGSLHARAGRGPSLGRAFVAPNAVLAGDVRIGDDAGVYFGCALDAGGARIVVGEASNVQDNSILVTDAKRGDLVIGRRVTVGHNVRIGPARVDDDALVGMASVVGDGVVVERGGCIGAGAHVEPGTVVRAGWIWAGRPARAFRELKDAEREWFAHGVGVYVGYARAYRAAL